MSYNVFFARQKNAKPWGLGFASAVGKLTMLHGPRNPSIFSQAPLTNRGKSQILLEKLVSSFTNFGGFIRMWNHVAKAGGCLFCATKCLESTALFKCLGGDFTLCRWLYIMQNIIIINNNMQKCCISLYKLGNQYIFHLQIKHWYLSIAGLNLDKNLKYGPKFGRKWWFWTDKKWHFGLRICSALFDNYYYECFFMTISTCNSTTSTTANIRKYTMSQQYNVVELTCKTYRQSSQTLELVQLIQLLSTADQQKGDKTCHRLLH